MAWRTAGVDTVLPAKEEERATWVPKVDSEVTGEQKVKAGVPMMMVRYDVGQGSVDSSGCNRSTKTNVADRAQWLRWTMMRRGRYIHVVCSVLLYVGNVSKSVVSGRNHVVN